MALGEMTTKIIIKSRTITTDAEGFQTETLKQVLSVRAHREGQHGSEAWRNRASFTDATDMFTIRRPNVAIKTDMVIECDGSTFEVTSVEDVRGKRMYIQILGREVFPSGAH